MQHEKQMALTRPDPERDHVLQELLRRSIRQESRIVQLMRHVGMKTDGREPIMATRNPV